jgi:hypothetical protein
MPYTHPVLGVPCMTATEFWHAEAKAENVEVDQVMDDYYTSLAKEEEEAAIRLKNDKDSILKMLKEYYLECETFIPVEVKEVLDTMVRINHSSDRSSVTCRVMCNDGKERTLKYDECNYHGSYMEPPDFDCNCVEVA